MTLLLAFVGTALKGLSTNVSATDIRKPTWLILEDILATQAGFCGQEWTLRTSLLVAMAVVGHLRVSTVFGTLTCKAAWRWLRSAGKWGLQYSSTAVTAEFVEDGFPA